MQFLVLDSETFFSESYTLKKMTTEAYVRDPQFKMHMLGYYAPASMAAPAEYRGHVVADNAGFRQLISESAVICHHAQFDLLALNHWYGLRPKFIFDTLSMARLVWPRLRSHSLEKLAEHCQLPQKTVPYNLFRGVRDLDPALYAQVAEGCKDDCNLTWWIFQRLLPHVPKEELSCIDTTIRMFSEPVLQLDRPRMETFLQAEKLRKARGMLQAGSALGFATPTTVPDMQATLAAIETELQSSDKFAVALQALGYACPMKWSEKQQKDIPALAKNDDGMQELLEHSDVRVQALAGARLGVKSTIDETRAERLLDSHTRGPMPVYLSFAGAKTLRFVGGDQLNWQNFRRGGEIRKSIIAPPGHKVIVADAAQVECRGVNHMAGEQSILDLFRAKRDVYCELGTKMYGRLITKADESERWLAKQVELGSGFGLGKVKLREKLARGEMGGIRMYISEDEAALYTNTYRSSHPNVVNLWAQFQDFVLPSLANGSTASFYCFDIRDHKLIGPNGAYMDYSGLFWGYYDSSNVLPDERPQWWLPGKKGNVKYYGGKLVENAIQFLYSGLLIRQAMVKIAPFVKLVSQVHDELIGVVPDEQAEQALAFMIETLRTPPAWCSDIPLDAEGMISQRYDK